jgi:hypothetical protein
MVHARRESRTPPLRDWQTTMHPASSPALARPWHPRHWGWPIQPAASPKPARPIRRGSRLVRERRPSATARTAYRVCAPMRSADCDIFLSSGLPAAADPRLSLPWRSCVPLQRAASFPRFGCHAPIRARKLRDDELGMIDGPTQGCPAAIYPLSLTGSLTDGSSHRVLTVRSRSWCKPVQPVQCCLSDPALFDRQHPP